ncbi:ribosome-binding factor A [Jannaschia pagri]|uniref:Ribosome-binding factor A n=1 Tax=Jannaschia pagri TaxID=2829797 RepID=A0ABQ4NKM5_9RHOB|nr:MULTISPECIES: 30S ribosome-binding factor RbfA [unclassified Jannaschia]GIT90954.1 ribosome-binding factor A [Jannaschia sp. AI_61]GIT94785.1 ribosome-binding factor A [Jannaschia sp. AI_62]
MARSQSDGGRGPSQRQLRVGELIRRTLSDVLIRGEIHDPDLQAMSITVGEVTVTRDLKIATCWVLPLGGKGKDDTIAALTRNKGALRRAVTKDMALKVAPDLRFRIDETFDRMDATRALFADERVRRDVEAPDRDGKDEGGGPA